MDITSDDISKVMRGGDSAGKFHPDVIVYSDMAVRTMIYNALCHFKERHLTNESSGRDISKPLQVKVETKKLKRWKPSNVLSHR